MSRPTRAAILVLLLAGAAPSATLAAGDPLPRAASVLQDAGGRLWSALRSLFAFSGHEIDPNGVPNVDSGHGIDPDGLQSSDPDSGHGIDPNG